jgi:2-hydroxy-6-oxonona-2,4-dienedioate hydrolase
MLNYRRYGSGPTLVFLHGFVGSAGYWLPQEIAFNGAYDVVSVDLPGFAKSADVTAPDTLSGYGDTVIALMDEIGVGSFHLVGFSMGGMIAQQMALDHGGRIDTLVLYGTASVGNMPSRFESWAESGKRVSNNGVAATTENTVATWFVDGADSPMHAHTLEVCQGASLEGCLTVMNAMMEWSAAERLGDIAMPTLVVCGDRDRSATPADAIVMWEGIPNARLSVLPGCAHGAHLEKPDMFNQVLSDFLAEQRA